MLSCKITYTSVGESIYSLVAAVVMAIVHEGEVCRSYQMPVQVICDKAGEPEWVWMLFSNGKCGERGYRYRHCRAFVVASTPETTQVAVSTLGKEEIAAAEFDKMVPSASNVTS